MSTTHEGLSEVLRYYGEDRLSQIHYLEKERKLFYLNESLYVQ